MKELSLNILDIAQNSIKAGASNIHILLNENEETLIITVRDDGCGMTAEILERVENPFYTTRTTRDVGMGIPLLKLAAEQTGGEVTITSVSETDDPVNHGTTISASFFKNHLDFTPLGDIVTTVCTLIHGAPDIDWRYEHIYGDNTVLLDTKQMREILGDVPLDDIEILNWIRQSLSEEYAAL
ncbi:MAG: sensor histidine kinase [Clostridia bacterium]|nr:sensor histidine kinase [Clostridia bacterium]